MKTIEARITLLRTTLLTILLMAMAPVVVAGPVDCGKEPIRMALYETGSFYFIENGQARGSDKDIFEELVKRSGCRFDTKVIVRARIWADLASGDLDMSVSGIQTPERDKFAWFAPYLTMKNYAIVDVDVARKVRQSSDFLAQPTLQFGVVRAFKHGDHQDRWLETLRAAGRVQESPDVETLFRKLKERRVDAIFSQPPTYRKKIADLGMESRIQAQDWTPGEKGVPHGLILAKSRFNEKDAEQWRALIETMRKDGTLKKIFSRYLAEDEAARILEF